MALSLAHALDRLGLSRPLHLTPKHVAALCAHTALSQRQLALALLDCARQYAHAPVSGFAVGAVAVAKSGHWYLGANLEFTGLALHHSVHAEQAAIGHAALFGETAIDRMVVSASPCGHCRQFMQELNQPELSIVLPDAEYPLNRLLPHAFGPADLGIHQGMLCAPPGSLSCHRDDALVQTALAEANASHAPYSHNRAGVALWLDDGRLFRGRYLENAAFNPGLGPMQLALSQLLLHGTAPARIRRAVLVESTAAISQLSGAAQALGAVCPIALEHLSL